MKRLYLFYLVVAVTLIVATFNSYQMNGGAKTVSKKLERLTNPLNVLQQR